MKKDTKSYRILIIEDCEEVLLSLKKLLFKRIETPIIVTVSDLKLSKEIISKENFDVILLDLSLRDLKGRDIFENIGSENFYKVIILSEPTDYDLTQYAVSRGISDYLLKSELSSRLLYKSIVYSIERKKNIKMLEESERRYSDLFHLNPQPMWVFEFDTKKFLRVNEAAVHHYGYSQEEFLEMTLYEIRPQEEVASFDEAFKILEETGRLHTKKKHRHRKKNGELIFIEVRCSTIYLDGIKCGLALCTDITERLQYIETIKERNLRLQEIAFTQSHIVRAPLANMMGILYLIKDGDLTPDEHEELLEHFITCGNELDQNIKEIVLKSSSFIIT